MLCRSLCRGFPWISHLLRCYPNHSLTSNTVAASTYEGDGKTVAHVLNKELDQIFVNKISTVGFRLNNGIQLLGPSVILPRTVLSWNISSVFDVNEKSLSLFSVLTPKVDILVFGYGSVKSLPSNIFEIVRSFAITNKIGLELLPTEQAVGSFNFLCSEKRLVAGVFIPPDQMNLYDDSTMNDRLSRLNLLHKED